VLALKGAELFDPSGMGRPMKAWVVLPANKAAAALEAIDAAPVKAAKKPKAGSKGPAAKKTAR
jgi:hypothetical protein